MSTYLKSTNYNLLYELVMAKKEIVGYVKHETFSLKDSPKNYSYSVCSIGFYMGLTYIKWKEECLRCLKKSDLINQCTRLKLEFILPTTEPVEVKPHPPGSAKRVFNEFWEQIKEDNCDRKELASLAFDAGHALRHKEEEL